MHAFNRCLRSKQVEKNWKTKQSFSLFVFNFLLFISCLYIHDYKHAMYSDVNIQWLNRKRDENKFPYSLFPYFSYSETRHKVLLSHFLISHTPFCQYHINHDMLILFTLWVSISFVKFLQEDEFLFTNQFTGSFYCYCSGLVTFQCADRFYLSLHRISGNWKHQLRANFTHVSLVVKIRDRAS